LRVRPRRFRRARAAFPSLLRGNMKSEMPWSYLNTNLPRILLCVSFILSTINFIKLSVRWQ